MKKTNIILLILTISITVELYAQIPYNQRYTTSVFDEVVVTTDVVYGNAPALTFPYLNENNTFPQDLLMDIYQPAGVDIDSRPVLVCAHSGAFVSGSKSVDDMVAFCDSMAHRGYVTASIDYRLGMNVFSSESSTRAVYRGVQDGRAAIRFLKENAEIYGVDTNNIYILGSSAGAYIAQHNLYMDTEDERPPETYLNPDLGCLDCSGNDFEHSGRANGLVSLWGALQDTILIIQENNIPVYLVHGTADATVPFGYGNAFGNQAFPATYGSSLVADRIENLGNEALKYFVFGEGHEFYGTDNGNWPGSPNAYWDTIFNSTVTFMYDIHKPTAGFYYEDYGVFEFFDESVSASTWYWDFGDGTYSIEQNPSHEYADYGYYKVTQFVESSLSSWDTISQQVSFWLDVQENIKLSYTIYPNPVINIIKLKDYEFKNTDNLKIYNTKGGVVKEIKSINSEYINVEGLPPGGYILIVHSKDQLLKARFIKL